MRWIIWGLFIGLSHFAFGQTKAYTLDNGLKIIVKENHRAPVVVSMIWYNVGSADEPGGLTGLSHLLEHLMFKGTPTYPAGVFSKTIASLGGVENAFTNTDYTAYYEELSAHHLATSFALEADRMRHLLLDKSAFSKELEVVKEERRLRTDDNPQALAFERFLATAHLASPYHHPVIGWMSDLNQMTVKDAHRWYNRYYAPNNATLVVVGDVTPEEVFILAKKYFGALPASPLPIRKHHPEPPHLGAKTVTIYAPAKVPMLILGYTAPTVKTTTKENRSEPYALEIIAGLLSGDDSSRFNQALVRGVHVASAVEVYYNLYARYQTQFAIIGIPAQGQSVSLLKKHIIKEIKKLAKTPVTNKELQRIKHQIIAQKTFKKDSLFEQAFELGLLETIGAGWEESEHFSSMIETISAKDVQQTAQRLFNSNKLTIAELKPLNEQQR